MVTVTQPKEIGIILRRRREGKISTEKAKKQIKDVRAGSSGASPQAIAKARETEARLKSNILNKKREDIKLEINRQNRIKDLNRIHQQQIHQHKKKLSAFLCKRILSTLKKERLELAISYTKLKRIAWNWINRTYELIPNSGDIFPPNVEKPALVSGPRETAGGYQKVQLLIPHRKHWSHGYRKKIPIIIKPIIPVVPTKPKKRITRISKNNLVYIPSLEIIEVKHPSSKQRIKTIRGNGSEKQAFIVMAMPYGGKKRIRVGMTKLSKRSAKDLRNYVVDTSTSIRGSIKKVSGKPRKKRLMVPKGYSKKTKRKFTKTKKVGKKRVPLRTGTVIEKKKYRRDTVQERSGTTLRKRIKQLERIKKKKKK